MPSFYVIRLGKDSIEDIRTIDALHQPPGKPIHLNVICKQVPGELSPGDYAFLWLGSDNNKGTATAWKQGLRAFAVVESKKGGPDYNDDHTIGLKVTVVFPGSISKTDLLAKAPAAYYWFSEVPVIGPSSSSNQTVQSIKGDERLQDVRALFYAIEAVHPGLRAQISKAHQKLASLFNYTPLSPGTAHANVAKAVAGTGTSAQEASQDAPKLLPASWILALASKGFVLVSGPSGTGKSRTARDIARALDYALEPEYAATAAASRPANCLAFVPVGADWTDSVPLIGFRNYFGRPLPLAGDSGTDPSHESWDPPAALRLLLRAVERPDQPHFLVLDEMNLSHVERYFAHFLSLLESNRGLGPSSKLLLLDAEAVRLIAETLNAAKAYPLETAVAQRLAQAGNGLAIPDNVFIIGTVNVDETTYMFSPKVLDRAHVIEMRSPDPAAYLKGESGNLDSLIPADTARTLLSRGAQRRRNGFWEREKPAAILSEAVSGGPFASELPEINAALEKTLSGLKALLEPVGFGFAYRTINEMCAYLATYLECGDQTLLAGSGLIGWQAAFDRAVVQKLLPKIHGNRRQLGDSLRAMQLFLEGGAASYLVGSVKFEVAAGQALGFSLPVSAKKTETMRARLEATGHTTFVV